MVFIPLAILAACSPADPAGEKKEITIDLGRDSLTIVFKGLENELVQALRADSDTAFVWSELFPVYKEATDPDLKGLEPPYPGRYRLRGGELLYTPDSGFAKGQAFRAEVNIPGYFDQDEAVRGKKLPGEVEGSLRKFRF